MGREERFKDSGAHVIRNPASGVLHAQYNPGVLDPRGNRDVPFPASLGAGADRLYGVEQQIDHALLDFSRKTIHYRGTCRTPRGARLKPGTTRGSVSKKDGFCAREGFCAV